MYVHTHTLCTFLLSHPARSLSLSLPPSFQLSRAHTDTLLGTVTDCTHMCVGPPVWEMWVHRLGTKLSMLASDAADEDEDDEDDR